MKNLVTKSKALIQQNKFIEYLTYRFVKVLFLLAFFLAQAFSTSKAQLWEQLGSGAGGSHKLKTNTQTN